MGVGARRVRDLFQQVYIRTTCPVYLFQQVYPYMSTGLYICGTICMRRRVYDLFQQEHTYMSTGMCIYGTICI